MDPILSTVLTVVGVLVLIFIGLWLVGQILGALLNVAFIIGLFTICGGTVASLVKSLFKKDKQ